MKIIVKNKNVILANDVYIAKTTKERMLGLMFSKKIVQGDSLWIRPCNSIHTFFMNYSIDAIFLDKSLKIIKVYRNLRPWRITPILWRAKSVLELEAMSVADEIVPGDQIEVLDV